MLAGKRRAEYAQRGVPLELVDPPLVRGDRLDDDREELVEQLHDVRGVARLGESGRALEVDEHDRRLAGLAPQFHTVLERVPDDVLADLAAEQIAHSLAFAEPRDHTVDAGLEEPDLAGVVDLHLLLKVTLLDAAEHSAQRLDPV